MTCKMDIYAQNSRLLQLNQPLERSWMVNTETRVHVSFDFIFAMHIRLYVINKESRLSKQQQMWQM